MYLQYLWRPEEDVTCQELELETVLTLYGGVRNLSNPTADIFIITPSPYILKRGNQTIF